MERFLTVTKRPNNSISSFVESLTPLHQQFQDALECMDDVFPPSHELIAAVLEKRTEALTAFENATDKASFEAAEELNKSAFALKESCDAKRMLFELV
jgi:hypothetical protein